MDELLGYTVVRLREVCVSLGLKKGGLKKDLIERVDAARPQ